MLEDYSPSRLYPINDAVKETNKFAYLTDKESLKRLVVDLCKRLHHPIAIIDYNALENAEITEKLESMVDMFPMRRSCCVFRKCAGDEYCKECDNFHARCMDIDNDKIEKRIRDSVSLAPDFFFPDYKHMLPQVLTGFSRPVIEYHCPMLGYRELLFPLLHDEKIFGVVFAGQILVSQECDSERNKSIQDSFFSHKRPEDLFQAFLEKYNMNRGGEQLSWADIKELIQGSDEKSSIYDSILAFRLTDNNELDYYSKNFETREEYYDFISRVCVELDVAEKKISEIYEENRKQTINNALKPLAKEYDEMYREGRKNIGQNIHQKRTNELISAWDALKNFTEKLCQEPSIKNLINAITVFGNGKMLKIEVTNKKRYVFSIPDNEFNKEGYIDFPPDSQPGVIDYITSLANPAILGEIDEKTPKDNCIMIRCQSIAMLIYVSDLSRHVALYRSLSDAIGHELSKINRDISLCTANLMKEKYLLTLRMYRHENAHISTRLMGNINRYLNDDGQRFMTMPEEKRNLICSDMKNTVQLISNIADNIGFVTGSRIPLGGDKPFNVVNMLYKWQVMFRDELENRNLDIIVYRGGYSSAVGFKLSVYLSKFVFDITRQGGNYREAPNEITINARLLELLVYNLVDNAVKYAYRGTNIYMIWSRVDDNYEFSLTSYGPFMEPGKAMYGLYVRGANNEDGQGDGLGLYVVDSIAKLLGLSFSHDSEKIASYNVPLIPWYIQTDFSRMKDYSKISESELMRELDGTQAVLATNEHSPTTLNEEDLTPRYLRKRIEWETWRTTFRVRIPIKKNK